MSTSLSQRRFALAVARSPRRASFHKVIAIASSMFSRSGTLVSDRTRAGYLCHELRSTARLANTPRREQR